MSKEYGYDGRLAEVEDEGRPTLLGVIEFFRLLISIISDGMNLILDV
jgi:hypothetical protein